LTTTGPVFGLGKVGFYVRVVSLKDEIGKLAVSGGFACKYLKGMFVVIRLIQANFRFAILVGAVFFAESFRFVQDVFEQLFGGFRFAAGIVFVEFYHWIIITFGFWFRGFFVPSLWSFKAWHDG